jgi:hypothetical protein
MHLSRRTLRRCMAVVENNQEAKMDDRASSFFCKDRHEMQTSGHMVRHIKEK